MVVYVADAVGEVFALGDEQGDELGGVGATNAEFGELLVFAEAELFQLIDVVDARHGTHGKTTQVRVAHDGLGVGVGDDADAFVS